jgi:AraC family L-rhamnose operon transcriptional activator RhaR
LTQPRKLFRSEHFLQNNLHLYVNRYTEDFIVPFHSHDFFEYCYVAEGKGYHHVDNETIPVHKGMLFAIPIGTAHVFRPSTPELKGNQLIVYNCLFDKQMLTQLSIYLQEPQIVDSLMSLGNANAAYFSVFDRDGSLEDLITKLYREMSVPIAGSTSMQYALLSQIVIMVYRLKHCEMDNHTNEISNFDHILQYVEQHLSDKLTLADLERISRWSNRHLQRKFMQHTGQSFGSYLQHLRVRKSCELLRNTHHKVRTIAELVGYNSTDTFNAVFKKVVGQSPTIYRKSQRKPAVSRTKETPTE